MFAPLGYESVSGLYQRFLEAAQRPPNKTSGIANCAHTRADKDFHAWNAFVEANTTLLKFLQSLKAVYVCSPEARIMLLDSIALSRELHSANSGFRGLWVIEQRTWRINCRRAEAWLETTENRLNDLRKVVALRQKNQLDATAAKVEQNNVWLAQQLASKLVDSFRCFNGNALVIPEEVSPTSEEVWNLVWTNSKYVSYANIGRPSIREQVGVAYNKRFPDGHSISWKEVQQEIEDECGIHPSVDTIKRAIGLRD